ncbi:MAG: methyltransferase domain-containing protein [Acidobacteriales bacterium]|nr:MAG: methyltransferase domain-containing protein [Terriglobales bacterium]
MRLRRQELAEFTGERVIPGEVEADLWNEHFARYVFASRLSRAKRVLDAGCGTGYGTAELARVASSVTGVDISGDAIDYARSHYQASNVRFLRASCAALPFQSGTFDLIVTFEVIEHLRDWEGLLLEARRLLAPGGQFVVSTPNKDCYAGSRGSAGPNPYHEHEFTFDEFEQELRNVFPHVSLFVQDHVEGFAFKPAKVVSAAEVRVEGAAVQPRDAHFLIAVCAAGPQTGAPTFVYIPASASLLRERERQIELLNSQIAELIRDRDSVLAAFRLQKEEMEAQSSGYEAKIAELEQDNRKKNEWGLDTSRQLAEKCQELARAVEALHAEERTVEERTNWALGLDTQIRELEAQLSLVKASRWIKLGHRLGVGPRLRDE